MNDEQTKYLKMQQLLRRKPRTFAPAGVVRVLERTHPVGGPRVREAAELASAG